MIFKIKNLLILIGIATLTTFIWRLLEVFLDGQIIESKAHNMVAVLFTWSLYKNLENNS